MLERLIKLEKNIEKIRNELLEIRDMRPGTISQQFKKPQSRAGGYHQLNYTYKMKSCTEYVRRGSLAETRRQTVEYRRFRKLVESWIELAIEYSRLKAQTETSDRRKSMPKAKPSDSMGKELHIKVTLCGVEPEVWRKLRMNSDMTLDQLHYAIQGAFGWENSHLHAFGIKKNLRYSSNQINIEESGEKDSRTVSLGDFLQSNVRKFTYEYDFGDSWLHEVQIEKVVENQKQLVIPDCIDGGRHCPPEDCGGVWGYEEFLSAIKDRNHPEHEEMKEWVGGKFNAEKFTVTGANKGIKEYQKYCDNNRL